MFKYFLFGFPLNWEECAGRKSGDDECFGPVSSPKKTPVNDCAVTVGAKKTTENVHAGEAIDIGTAAPADKKSKSVSNSTKSNVGAISGVKAMRTRLKTSEYVPAGEATDVVKVTSAKKCKSVSDSAKSNVGATSGVKDMKKKLKTSENVPAGESIDVAKAAPAIKSNSGSNSAKSKVGATSAVKDRKTKLKASENVPAGEAIDAVKATPAKKSKNVSNSAKSGLGVASGVKDVKTKLTFDTEVSSLILSVDVYLALY